MSIYEEIEEFKRQSLENILNQLTQEQVAFFYKIYPNRLKEDQLITAINLCDRTLEGNTNKLKYLQESFEKI
jgi:3-methyladenine DNA glycosylase AlkC